MRKKGKSVKDRLSIDIEVPGRIISEQLLSKNSSFADSRIPDLQNQISQLTEQNNKLQQEVDYLKGKLKDCSEHERSHTNTISKLQSEVSRQRMPMKSMPEIPTKTLRKIEKRHGKLMDNISSLQDRTLQIISKKKQEFIQDLDLKFGRLLQEEKAKLQVEASIDKEKEIAKLNQYIQFLESKLLHYEQLNEAISKENKEVKKKFSELKTEYEALHFGMKNRVKTRSINDLLTYSHTKSTSKIDLSSPKNNLKTSPLDKHIGMNYKNSYLNELDLSNKLRKKMQSLSLKIEGILRMKKEKIINTREMVAKLTHLLVKLQSALKNSFPKRNKAFQLISSVHN